MIRSTILFLAILAGASVFARAGYADSRDAPESRVPVGQSATKPEIELGFNKLYALKFMEARRQFEIWEQKHPGDPLGYIATAASYLFEEFHEQRVLTSEFFLDDKRLLGGIEGKPDEKRILRFKAANQKGKELALKQLDAEPNNADALFALTAANGLQANCAAIIEKRQMESLSLIRKGEGYARRLLELNPDEADAWFSIGASNYIIANLPSYKRFFLWFGGIRGEKRLGIEQMRITAEKGRYLKYFAKIFLALAAMREKQEDVARGLFRELADQFPENPLYQSELARLGSSYARSQNGGH